MKELNSRHKSLITISAAASTTFSSKDKSTILVTDDALDQAEAISFLLRKAGYRVLTASPGREAYEVALREHTDLVISSVLPPSGADSHELCRLIRADKSLRATPILFVSSMPADAASGVENFKAEADAYLYPEELDDPLRFIARVTQLVEHKQSIERLCASENRYRELMEQTSDLIFVLDQQANLVEVNTRACQVLDYTRAELLQFNLKDLVFRDDLLVASFRFAEVQAGRTVFTEARLRSKDGTPIRVEINAKMLENRRIQAVVRDITKRTQAEERLRKSEERYWLLFESSPLPMWVYDLGTLSLIAVNEAAVDHYGYTRDEFLIMTIKDIRPPEDVPALLNSVKIMPHTLNAAGTWRHRKKDGTIIHVQIISQPVMFGEIRARIVVANDVTKRQPAEEQILQLSETLERQVAQRTEQLQEANKELESFCYSVSHDLRAPLRIINGVTELLQERAASVLDETSRKYLTFISESAQQTTQLVDDLLAFSFIARSEIECSIINMNQLVQELRGEIELETSGRQIVWKIAELPEAKGDLSMLKVALRNILSNAVKYTRKRAEAVIEIGIARSEREGTYFVRDNGVGFEMRSAEKLFGVFQRLHSAEEFEGTGVGLASVQRIIHRHGGRIWAEGEVEIGATFYFTLPFDDEGQSISSSGKLSAESVSNQ